MGRDVAGLRIDRKSNVDDMKSNGSVHVGPKGILEIVEIREHEPDDRSIKGKSPDERSEKLDALIVNSTNHEPEEKVKTVEAQLLTEKKLSPSVKSESGSAVIVTVSDAKSIEPVTPGKKQISFTDLDNVVETVNDSVVNTSPKFAESPQTATKSRVQLQPSHKQYYDEEDNWSMASSAVTSRTLKSRITVPVAPKFTVIDRLERRKEFYTKLEEKHKALEKERLEYEARTKEEEQAAIKLLRKNMVVKAKPVPNFYREGPPPKVELKKLPVTRAKSPNLSRRKSCGDVIKSSPDDKGFNGRATRHSVGIYKQVNNNSSPINTPKSKDRITPSKLNGSNKVKFRWQQKEIKGDSQVKDQGNTDVVVES